MLELTMSDLCHQYFQVKNCSAHYVSSTVTASSYLFLHLVSMSSKAKYRGFSVVGLSKYENDIVAVEDPHTKLCFIGFQFH